MGNKSIEVWQRRIAGGEPVAELIDKTNVEAELLRAFH